MSPPARLALDLQALQVDGLADRGIGRYAASLAAALAGRDRVAAALLAPELPPPAGLPPGLVGAGLVDYDGAATLRRLLASGGGPLVHHVLAPFAHSGATDAPRLVAAPHWARSGCPRVVTLYDLIPLHAPAHYLSAPGAEERYRSRARWVAASDLILAISDHTRTDAVELLGCDPARVVTVGAGVSSFWAPPDGLDEALFRSVMARWVDRRYLLCVSGSDSRKNAERLIEAVGLLARSGCDTGLVVAGHLTPAWTARLATAAAASGVADRVQLIGAVDDELLRSCYRRAALTVMPSLAEGSGLPVLESAACGTPAAASATTALREVAATPLATFDPSDPASIAAVVGDLLVDGPRRAEVAAAQAAVVATSAWDAVAGRVLEAVDRMVAERPASATAASPTRHLLVAAPVLPDGGGIGAYTTRLLAEATTGDDGTGAPDAGVAVTVVADHPLPPSLAAGCRRVHPDLVGTDVRPASFDATVYALGNSDGHLGRVQLALRHPGWLWLHEARLPALATRALRHLDDDAYDSEMRRLLARAYPGRAPWPAARRAGRNEVALAEAGVGLAGLLAERSTGILVNSEVARRLVLLDLPPGAAHPPVRVLPLMCPAVDVEAHPTAGGDAGLVTFGIVSMPKQPDLLVDVAALLECPLRFVGPCPPVLRQLIDERAAARGIGAHVTVTGEVDDAGWAHWMRQATVAVQLRSGSSGESSAALLDALASGTPVATSLLSAVDLPEGVVRTVAATDAEALAADLAPLLASPAARLAQSEAGLRFARQHQAQDLLAALLAAVTA